MVEQEGHIGSEKQEGGIQEVATSEVCRGEGRVPEGQKGGKSCSEEVLRTYGVKGELLRAVRSLYDNGKACVSVQGQKSDWFRVG